MRQAILFCCAVLAAVVQAAPGAEPKGDLRDFAVRIWSKAEGLPDTSVTAITQTRDGYLWIGTGAGLFRFDGINFTKTPLAAGVTSLCEDKAGNLWAGTQFQGVYCLQNGQVRHYGTGEGLLDDDATSIALDSEGHLWIGTRRGVDRYDGSRFLAFTTTNGLQNNSVLNVHTALSGTVWITTAGGTCRYLKHRMTPFHFPAGDREGEEFLQAYEDRRGNLWAFCSTYVINLADKKRINHFPGEKSAATRIWSLCEGRGERLWIGASGRGVFCFDGNRFQPVTLNEGRWPNDVQTIFEDQEGDLWLGISEIGLVELRPQSFTLLTENRGLPSGAATGVVSDNKGRLCVAMEAGGVYSRNTDHFDLMSGNDPFLGQELVTSLCATPDGSIWTGASGSGLCQIKNQAGAAYTTADGLEDEWVLNLCAANDGSVWVGERFGVVQQIAQGRIVLSAALPEAADAAITAMLPASGGGLFIGTDKGRLIRVRENFSSAAVMPLPRRLEGKAILSLLEHTNGGLWMGSDGGGLGYTDGKLERAWDSQNGLPDNVVWDMAEDDDGNLWLATPRGLCRVNSDSVTEALAHIAPLKAKLVYETDPTTARVPGFTGPRAWRTASGELWFALSSGLVGVDTGGRDSEKPPPQVHIESILVNDKPLGLAPTLTFPSHPRTMAFRYAGLSFDAPEKVRFRHKLEGIDANWVQNGAEREVDYGPLPYGHYVFHVTACNADGNWNETGASVAFIIPPPLWRTPWALCLGGLVLAGFGVGAVRLVSHRRLRLRLRSLEQQRAMERERMRIAQNMHDEIGSKLTKISYLSERAKVSMRGDGAAQGKIDSIATTSRELLKALDEMVWAVNPRNDSLEHVAAYLSQAAREYYEETSVGCNLRAQTKLPDIEMSAETRHNLFLAFEESLNNVLKHARATEVNIDISVKKSCLRIVVEDNGCGFETMARPGAKTTGGNGLRNIRARLESIGGWCGIESAPGRGTCITLSLPLPSAKIRQR